MPDRFDEITENCDICYESTIVECTAISFAVGLSGAYNLNILDKFSKLYVNEIIVSGSFTIDQTLFPKGFFNKNAGAFELYLTSGSGFTIPMTINSKQYNCIILTIQ